ncbi:ribosome biogenesis GTPase YlqF [Candidatus Marinamargulisbacteria bacterium SCGC AG-414-C22]|nr:ribosome biogenesis GTPase YlqF [Candidatus Marinamargulisbacteria bacterium SCGC AG-414-C22]
MNKTNVQWFPGHMAKTIKELKNEINQVDIIIECVDARTPASCNYEFFNQLATKKQRIIVFTKIDLANPVETKKWEAYYQSKNITTFGINILKKQGLKALFMHLKSISEKSQQQKRFHITKVMIIGLPNIGKSALINALAKKQAAKVQNKPAVTKQTQWVVITPYLFLLDTPGVLMPKISNTSTIIKLALIKCIKDTLLDYTKCATWLISFILDNNHVKELESRYKISINTTNTTEILLQIGAARHCLLPNKEINEDKVVRLIIDDYRKGAFGKLTFDRCP